MFESLTKKLEGAFKNIRGMGKLSEANMKEGLQQIRLALLEADVNYKVVKKFIEDVQQAAMGRKVLDSINPSQQIVKIVYDELVKLMGGANAPLKLAGTPPTIIMMVGLQGQGKTTTAGKLALMLRKQHHKPLLVGADVYRPAAIRQLEIVAQQAEVEFFTLGEHSDPVNACVMARGEAQMRGCDVIILDTAGRLHVDQEMVDEVRRIHRSVSPHEILFVANAMTGQDAVNSAKQFNDTLPLTGVVLTQMDGDARGGAAISLITVTGKPVKFVGTGEKLDALEAFHPNRMADQILGMGDIVSLVERAQQVVDKDEAENWQKKIRRGELNLEDFMQQLKQMKKMGSFTDLIQKIPGMNKLMGENVAFDEREFRQMEAIISSMTREERKNPKIINGRRRVRIAEGSGTRVPDVNRLLREFDKTRDMMKKMFDPKNKGPKGPKGRMPMMPF